MSPSPAAVATALTLRECQIQASLLLKDLRSGELPRAHRAAARLQRLPLFRALSPEQILARPTPIQRKHALWTVALERGYPSWVALKAALEGPQAPVLDTTLFFRGGGYGYLNHWFARYEEARETLDLVGGFLFPYCNQFFVCPAGLVDALGLDASHSDWERIGYDWVRPADLQAHARLAQLCFEAGYAA